jgi:hypothetical protein
MKQGGRLGDPLAPRQVNFSRTDWITFHWRDHLQRLSDVLAKVKPEAARNSII